MGTTTVATRCSDASMMTARKEKIEEREYGEQMGFWDAETGSRDSSHSPRASSVLSPTSRLWLVLVAMQLFVTTSTAVFINFHNCLSPDRIGSNPKELQFQPLFVWATFNSNAASHNINVTAYGNIAGIATQQPYPAPDDPQWANPNDTVGKIPDISGPSDHPLYTTFTTQFNVLDYTPYDPPAVRFCNSSSLTQCPLAPVFDFKGNQ